MCLMFIILLSTLKYLFISDFLKSPSNIVRINLANNSLSDIDPEHFAVAKTLREINLSENKFHKLSSEVHILGIYFVFIFKQNINL